MKHHEHKWVTNGHGLVYCSICRTKANKKATDNFIRDAVSRMIQEE